MTDVMSPEKRSRLMSHIRGTDTVPEKSLRKALVKAGIRGYRLRPDVPGRPDIAFTKRKIAIFVDGCFWHGCPKCYIAPETNVAFWKKKLEETKCRDQRVDGKLMAIGWRPMHFWEHEVEKGIQHIVELIRREIEME